MIYGDIGETADYMYVVTSYYTRSVSVSRSHIATFSWIEFTVCEYEHIV